MSYLNIYSPGSMKALLANNTILGFFGEYRWLSNFWPATIYIEMPDCEVYKFATTEAAYQAHKSTDPAVWREFAKLTTGREAKYLGSKIVMRDDFELDRDEVMLAVNRPKFQYRELRSKLAATKGLYLEETNNWGDTYWGVCNGIGLNKLGHTLMKIRDENE